MIFQCFQSLNVYGKEPEALENVVSIFTLVLADYPMEKIRQAFGYYLKFNDQMPTPSAIVNIIERGNKPPLERSVYIAISKKPAEEREKEDWQYLREYEKFAKTGEY